MTHHPLGGNTAQSSLLLPGTKKNNHFPFQNKLNNVCFTHETAAVSKSQQLTVIVPHLILQVPDAILVSEFLIAGATLGKNATLEPTHVEEQVGVVFAVNGHEAVLPLHRGHRPGQAVLDVPEHCTSTGEGNKICDKRHRSLLQCYV